MTFMCNIVVVPHDPAWAGGFAQESTALSEVFASCLVGLHHIGSTSVPGLAAKPVIDMLLVVGDVDEADGKNDEMAALGYEAKGEFGIPGRRYFTKGRNDARTFHLHAYGVGHPAVKQHLDFRDYLIAHPDEATVYGELKKELAGRYRDAIQEYMAGKDPWIKEVLARAQSWR